jgi:ribosomal protein L4
VVDGKGSGEVTCVAGELQYNEFERQILRERVRAGLTHARQNGKKWAGPSQQDSTGIGKAEIARRLQIGRTSVRRILDRCIFRRNRGQFPAYAGLPKGREVRDSQQGVRDVAHSQTANETQPRGVARGCALSRQGGKCPFAPVDDSASD